MGTEGSRMGEPRKCKYGKNIACGSDFDPDNLQDCSICLLNLAFRDFQQLFAVIQKAQIAVKDSSQVFASIQNHVAILTAYKEFLRTNYPQMYEKVFPGPKPPEEPKQQEGDISYIT